MVQKVVNVLPAIGVAGQKVATDSARYLGYNPLSDGTVTVGAFAFAKTAGGSQSAPFAIVSGTGSAEAKPLGFVERVVDVALENVTSSGTNILPEGAVAKSNTNPVTYYGTFKDAVEDANDPETSGAEGQEQPFTITLIKDVSDDDLGEAPIVLDPDVPININLNNHKLGDENSDKQIQMANPGGGEPAGQTVTIQNQPESGEPAGPGAEGHCGGAGCAGASQPVRP